MADKVATIRPKIGQQVMAIFAESTGRSNLIFNDSRNRQYRLMRDAQFPKMLVGYVPLDQWRANGHAMAWDWAKCTKPVPMFTDARVYGKEAAMPDLDGSLQEFDLDEFMADDELVTPVEARDYDELLGEVLEQANEQAGTEHDVERVEFFVNNPNADAAAAHQNWLDRKVREGWSHGIKRNEEKKTSPRMLPFHELPQEYQAEVGAFADVVGARRMELINARWARDQKAAAQETPAEPKSETSDSQSDEDKPAQDPPASDTPADTEGESQAPAGEDIQITPAAQEYIAEQGLTDEQVRQITATGKTGMTKGDVKAWQDTQG